MNIECGQSALDELSAAFRFNDAVIRNLVMSRSEAITDTSPLAKSKEEREEEERRERAFARRDREESEAAVSEVAVEIPETVASEGDLDPVDVLEEASEATDTDDDDEIVEDQK
jgi:small subunit ribosomal protein S6